MPKLSILVPTFNRAHWLKECLDSLASTTVDCEIVVADNASTDGTDKVLATYADDPRFQIYRHEKNILGGPNYAFCLSKARGEFICVFGDDDMAMPGCFEAKLALFERMPELDMVYSLWHTIDEESRDMGVIKWPGLLNHSYLGERNEFRDLLVSSYILLQSVVFRRHLYEIEGGLDTSLPLKAATDWHLLLRYARGRKTAFLHVPTVKVRVHETSYTSTVARTEAMFANDKLHLWRYWLLEHPEAPVLDQSTWQRIAQSLEFDVTYSFGNDSQRHAEYQQRLNELKEEIAVHHENALYDALTGS